MATLVEAASHRDQRTVARHSPSPPPIETIALQLPRVLRPIHLRMQLGRCKVRFAMWSGPADTHTRPALTSRPDLISVLLPQQRIAVTVAPATEASQSQGHLMVNHPMWLIGRARMRVPWVLLGRLDLLTLPAQLQYCDTSSSDSDLHPADSIQWIFFIFLISRFSLLVSWDLLSVLFTFLFCPVIGLVDGVFPFLFP